MWPYLKMEESVQKARGENAKETSMPGTQAEMKARRQHNISKAQPTLRNVLRNGGTILELTEAFENF